MKKAVMSAVAVVVFSGVAMCQTQPAPVAPAAAPAPVAVKKAVAPKAEAKETKAAVKKINGTVSSYDAATGALSLKSGKKEASFTIAGDVKIVDKAGKPATSDALKAGAKVALTTSMAADKTVTVSEIKVIKAAK